MYQRTHLTFCLAFTIVVCASNLHINLRMSRDCLLTWCVYLFACVCQSLASFTSFWTAVTLCRSTHCQYNTSIHRMEQLIRFHKKILTLFTFTFAKRGIQCNIAHRTQLRQLLSDSVYCHLAMVEPFPHCSPFN